MRGGSFSGVGKEVSCPRGGGGLIEREKPGWGAELHSKLRYRHRNLGKRKIRKTLVQRRAESFTVPQKKKITSFAGNCPRVGAGKKKAPKHGEPGKFKIDHNDGITHKND